MKNFFVSHKSPVAVVLLIILSAGFFAFSRLQNSLFPEVTFPKIKIIADAGLQPVGKMMITVTRPLENAVKRVPHLKLIRSTTSRGSCEISAFIDWGTNIDLSKQQIESAINQIQNELPSGTQISVEKMNPSILPVSGYVLEGKDKSDIELNQIATYMAKPFLSQVDGVSEVRIIGGKVKEYHVILLPDKMAMLGITPSIITSAFAQTNFISSNGYLTDNNRLYLNVTNATPEDLSDLEEMVLQNDGKRILRLKDIAQIKIEEQTQFIRVNSNGTPAVLVAILKQPNANLISVSNDVKSRIESLNHGVLPAGISLRPYYVQADFVNESIRSVSDSLWLGLLLAMLVAFLFLRSLKSSAVILLTIPVTIALTIIVLYLLDYNFNIMTLGAIAASIGLIIDDAIVVVEQIHRTHEEHPEVHTRDLLSQSVNYLLPAMIGSSLSTIVIFLPFVLLGGVAGAYFNILTTTMMVTLVCSFFITWIGLPVIYLLLTKRSHTTDKKEKEKLTVNRPWIRYFIQRPIISFLFLALIIISAFFLAFRLETGFLPEMDEGSIVLDYFTPAGTSLQETDRILSEVEKMFPSIPEIETYSRRTGTQMGFFITEPNRGDYLIQLKKNRSRTTDEVIDNIRQKIESTQPALKIDFGQVIGDMLGDLMSSTQPIEIKIYGNDQKVLHQLANKVASIAESVSGVADVYNGITMAGPSVTVSPDYRSLAQYNLTPLDLQNQLKMQLEGTVAGSIYEKEQLTPIRIIYPLGAKTSLTEFRNSKIVLPDGKLISLSRVATVNLEVGTAEIERENLQSMIAVTARLNERDLGSVMKDIQSEMASQMNLPVGYYIDYGGAFKEQKESFRQLLLILLTGALLVFAVMLFMFRKIRVALLILFISVTGISGSIIALAITNSALNVGSYTGLIMIIGIIGENAIFTYLQFQDSLRNSTVTEAIEYAISTRLRPKLMTALGAIIALLPIALGIGTGAKLHQPLAISVIGGFVIALPLLLIVYPTLLKIISKKEKP